MTHLPLAFAALFAALLALPVHAGRLALVIANNAYEELDPLLNTHADGEAYADAFATLGYEVIFLRDLDLDGMSDGVDRFLDRVRPGDDLAFVYSGHGWSDGQVNYLVPTDAPREGSDRRVKRASLALKNGFNGILDELHKAGGTRVVAIVDACRDRPFQSAAGTRSTAMSRGLAPVQAATGTFVIFSAGEGQRALDRLSTDGPGTRPSVFTRHFAPLLTQRIPLEAAISKAQVATAEAARSQNNHVQHPAYYDQVLGDTCLSDRCDAATPVAAAAPPPADPCDALYAEADRSATCFAFEGYARRCPSHAFLPLAEAYLDRNCKAEDVAAAPAPAQPSKKVEAYVAQVRKAYNDADVTQWAPYQLTVPSCDSCAPYLVYCNKPVSTAADLNLKKIRVRVADQTVFTWVEAVGGVPVYLPFAEVRTAMQVGVVDCAVSGGVVPE